MTGWPSAADKRSAIKRAMTSAPPAGNGTIILITLLG
jgi:hypothetical protein